VTEKVAAQEFPNILRWLTCRRGISITFQMAEVMMVSRSIPANPCRYRGAPSVAVSAMLKGLADLADRACQRERCVPMTAYGAKFSLERDHLAVRQSSGAIIVQPLLCGGYRPFRMLG
jgi:hypothetical protein